MREYRFKRGYRPITEKLEEMLVKHFGGFEKEEDKYKVRLENTLFILWLNDKALNVESKTQTSGKSDTAKVLQIYNKFLEELTGYTVKERRKKMRGS
jgi:Uncharacterized protein conserved in archaea